MEIGVVKWFNNVKGFGFITIESFDGDVFAHFSAIESEGYRSLKVGQKVYIELVNTDKGASASRIIPFKE